MRKGNSQKQIKKPLTIRERRLIKGLAEGLTTTDALRKAGYAESTVRKQSGRTVGNSRVLSALKELMEKKGLSDSALIDSLAGGLKSTRVISARVIEKNAGAAIKEKPNEKINETARAKNRYSARPVFMKHRRIKNISGLRNT